MVRLKDKKAGELKRVLYSYSGVLLLDVFDIGKKGFFGFNLYIKFCCFFYRYIVDIVLGYNLHFLYI
jgi:hypothetical protein